MAGQTEGLAGSVANLAESTNNLAETTTNLAGSDENLAGSKRAENGRVTESIGDGSPNENQGEAVVEHESNENAHQEGEEMKRKAS
jgi:hypothetical protein